MLNNLVYLIFILSVALTAGGIILSSKLRNRYKSEVFSTLLYFQVFIFAFGFYSIWGQILIKAFLSSQIPEDLLSRFTWIAVLLGLPFLVFAWLMLIRFVQGISGREKNRWLPAWFLLLNFAAIVALGWIGSKAEEESPMLIIKYYFMGMNLLYAIIAALITGLPGKGRPLIHEHDRKIIAPAFIVVAAVQGVPLLFYESQAWLGLIFILVFFTGNIFLPAYLNYWTFLSSIETDQPEKDISFEGFCSKFEISPRESDIVREICNGLSNKEISGKLFISLQTVKDHTHRIYIKTNVRSRVQLINLVKEEVQVTGVRHEATGNRPA